MRLFSSPCESRKSLYTEGVTERAGYYMMTVSVWREYERRGLCFEAGLGVLVLGLGGRCNGPDGEVILAFGVRLAHLEGGR